MIFSNPQNSERNAVFDKQGICFIFQLRNIGEKIRRFVFEKFVKICRDLDDSSEKKNSDWGLKMEVEERLEKFEATVENTNTKVRMLHIS